MSSLLLSRKGFYRTAHSVAFAGRIHRFKCSTIHKSLLTRDLVRTLHVQQPTLLTLTALGPRYIINGGDPSSLREDFASIASELRRGVCFLFSYSWCCVFLQLVFLKRVVETLMSVPIMRFTRKYSLEGVAINLTVG
jgi:hypothetical protein